MQTIDCSTGSHQKKGGVTSICSVVLLGNYLCPTWKFDVICSCSVLDESVFGIGSSLIVLWESHVLCVHYQVLQSLLVDRESVNVTLSYLEVLWEVNLGKVYMVRAKELFTWTPSFESIKEQDYSSEDESVQGVGSKENKYNTYEKEEGQKKPVIGEFGGNRDSPSLSHPPGFSPVGSLNSSDKELNKEFSPTISAKVMNNSQVVHEEVSFNSVGGSGNNKGGSVLGVLDEMIRVGRAMGYSMEGCEKDIESIINSKGDETVFR
ncbi:hypothetical protein Tco_0475918 [Tanacetum coccineum]